MPQHGATCAHLAIWAFALPFPRGGLEGDPQCYLPQGLLLLLSSKGYPLGGLIYLLPLLSQAFLALLLIAQEPLKHFAQHSWQDMSLSAEEALDECLCCDERRRWQRWGRPAQFHLLGAHHGCSLHVTLLPPFLLCLQLILRQKEHHLLTLQAVDVAQYAPRHACDDGKSISKCCRYPAIKQ